MERNPASIWDKWNSSGGPKYPHAKIIQYVFRNFPAQQRPDTKVLDLGCGGGVHLWFLGREGFQTYGMDISKQGVAHARNWLERESIPYQDLRYGNIYEMDYPSNYFDLIICCGVLECVDMEEANRIVEAAYQLLKVGGQAVFIFMSEGDFRAQSVATELSLHPYNKKEVEALFAKAAWSSCHIDYYVTTFQNETTMSKDFLITLEK